MGFCMYPALCLCHSLEYHVRRKDYPHSPQGKRWTPQRLNCLSYQLRKDMKGGYHLRMKRATDVLSHHWEHSRPRQFVRATTTTGVEW